MDIQKKVNHPSKELKRIKNLLAITMVRLDIHKINIGAMEKLNSMENAILAISMVIGLMNAKRHQNLKENVTNVRKMDTSHPNAKLGY